MLNHVWLALLLAGVLIAGFTGRMREAGEGAITAAGTAITIAVGLVGIMTLWLGLMRLAETAGLVQLLAQWLRPLMRRLFPDVPAGHPAMGSMLLNIAANMLGLTNAATPLGLRAMRDLESLNRQPGTATNAMCTFLAINTGSVQLLPISAIAVLATAGSVNPTAIVGTTLLATCCSSLAGLVTVKWLERWRVFAVRPEEGSSAPVASNETGEATQTTPTPAAGEPRVATVKHPPLPWPAKAAVAAFLLCFLWFAVVLVFPQVIDRSPTPEVATQALGIRVLNAVSMLAMPFLIAFFPFFAALRGVPVYEEFIEGAKGGFGVAVKIMPFLVGMLVAIGFLRGAGGIELLTKALHPAFSLVGFPPELLPMALLRPLTGSGSLAVLGDLVKTLGPDHLVTRTAGTIFGSTETTFYVLAVYFGAVGIRRTRHALAAGLAADAAGIIASVIVCRLVFG